MNYETMEKIKITPRVQHLRDMLFEKMPEIEADRAVIVTESYKETENLPIIKRRSHAFRSIMEKLPITIREGELIVGSNTKMPRSCQTYPEYSFEWLDAELDTVETRSADPFYIAEDTKKTLKEVHKYWQGRTTSDLATSYMAPEALKAIEHNIFTTGNYFYNGVGHLCVQYDKVLAIGYLGIKKEAEEQLKKVDVACSYYAARRSFLEAVIESCDAAITYANRYADLAEEMAKSESGARKEELLQIARNCRKVPANGAESFYEACQSFWFVQMLIQTEGSGHSISPGRFDTYMYPYFKKDYESGKLTLEFAQELVDCLWIKLNDLNKVRDAVSAEGFAGYSLFQNLIVGGQTPDGKDSTNELSYICLNATLHILLPQPSISIRVWNGSPTELLIMAAHVTRTGVGLPAYYNDEVIIPSMLSRGVSLEDARNYCIIGCVEPQAPGKTDGWHDAAFFNMLRPLELVFSNGKSKGEQISIKTGEIDSLDTYEKFFKAYEAQMDYMIKLLVNSDNAIDKAHARRCPLPFLSAMVEDCIGRGKSVQEGGAVYNFKGPQGLGIANMADALYAVKTLVYDEKKYTLAEVKAALEANFSGDAPVVSAEDVTIKIAGELGNKNVELNEEIIREIYKNVKEAQGGSSDPRFAQLLEDINALPKFGNDNDVVDEFAREAAYTYTRPMEQYKNPRGGMFQAGLYPVSANVPLGAQTGATPDGRLAFTPIADGVSPAAGRDVNGPTAAANSVSKLDHGIASNGTLFNMKFHPSALKGDEGLYNFVSLIRAYFDRKGMHVQFNVVSRETLIDAQKNPENYKNLVVRVAGYSALFTTLSRSLQDDIINRTEQQSF
ncbi:MAG: glycyl radical protein [Clostridia bacterium]|nr:glycyl radical protein [Clostridia bacterium]